MSNTALQLHVDSNGNACPTSTRLSFGHSGNQSHSHNQSSYQPRSSQNSAYHRLVEDNFEKMELVWDSKYQQMYGYWRPHVLDVIQKYLDCGDPHLGFARVKCTGCNTEYLLPFSCKCRGFCPSCHQRRVVEFGEYLRDEVLELVPHRQWVLTIPKRLRPYFMHKRKLLAKLSLCAWDVLSDYLKTSVSASADDNKVKPGAIIAVQTFGELINFNPHLHIIASDGCYNENGDFLSGISPNADDLTVPFAKAVLKMLKKEKVISLSIINNMSTWEHSGFNVHCGTSVSFSDTGAVERLARYIVRAPISQERMRYIPKAGSPSDAGRVVYEGKTTGRLETFSPLDFLARLVTHIPNKYEQTVRYYGYYSNKSRGVRARAYANAIEQAAAAAVNGPNTPGLTSAQTEDPTVIIPVSLSRKRFKKNWARLIQKVYNIDPLECPKCGERMRIIAFIEEEAVIKKILSHLNLWLPQYHDPPDYLGPPGWSQILPAARPCNSGCADNSLSSSASLATASALPHEAEICGNLQLNMFSDRSYEWWENRNTTTHRNVNSHYNSDCEYQNPYEDEFSQEVLYDE